MNKKGKFTERGKSILKGKNVTSLEDFLKEPKISEESAKGEKIHNLKISKIKENPYQPRQYFDADALSELSKSIKSKGIIQPIIVRDDEQGHIYLVAGERRLKASELAGLDSIPAIFSKGNPLEISLIENLQRENLKPIEEAEAFKRMINEFSYTQEQLSIVIGKARTTITEILSLTKLPEEIKIKCRQADIPKRTLIEVAKQKDHKAMIKLFNQIQTHNLKSDQVRKITRKKDISANSETVLKELKHIKDVLSNLDIRGLSNNDYLEVIKEMKDLKKTIDQLLS